MELNLAFVAVCVLVLVSCCLGDPTPVESAGGADIPAVVKGGNEFAVDLYARLSANEGNLFFSPASIDTALAMTYAGAAGETAEQMARTLRFALPGEKLHPAFAALLEKLNHPASITEFVGPGQEKTVAPYELVVSNALWGHKGEEFRPAFLELLKQHYGAGMQDVDFNKPAEARKTINGWIEQQTKDKIKDLIPTEDTLRNARLVLTNAVYFKSNWAEKFHKEATRDEAFHLSADASATVPMMHQTGQFEYVENDEFQAVKLPYKANELSMVILLPRKTDGLPAVEKSLTAESLSKWIAQMHSSQVELAMPKFTFSGEFNLKDALASMGMPDAFDASKADFSGMTGEKDLFIGAVLHKAFIAVDEEGTEAAAATAVVMVGCAAPGEEKPKIFRADHPFLFLIRHEATGEILFIGRLANPQAK
jgi:serpin B